MKQLDIIWTNQFKKDYKLAMKRHMNMDEMMLSECWRLASSYLKSMMIMACQVIGQDIESAIFYLIGY